MLIKHPEIISVVIEMPSKITLQLFIMEQLVYFQGHFPGVAILPGVVQADWAIFFAQKYLHLAQENIWQIDHLKFTKVVKPNTKLFLTIQLEKNLLTFKYFNNDAVYSQGKIKL